MNKNGSNHKHKKWDLLHLFIHHKLNYVVVAAFSFVVLIGVLVTFVEQGVAKSNIKTFGDGIWWAFSTVAAVGYGDRVPVTTLGRTMAVTLMFVGIALFSIITANIASFFVEEDEERELEKIKTSISRLEEKVDKLLEKKLY